ncbi:MAG: T9SS type A sorting domain-containing protein [Ignavibacteriae bacterium]|nr:T9SS type A sorting domain-containing protein [Ignavibacteriota bacterium]
MKFLLTLLLAFSFFSSGFAGNTPHSNFSDLLVSMEKDPKIELQIRNIALQDNSPMEIYLEQGIYIRALGIEDGKIVYGIINNLADIYAGAEVSYLDNIITRYDILKARVHYADGTVLNPTLGIPQPSILEGGSNNLLLIPESTNDKVWAFNPQNGDLVESDFIPPDAVNLSLPQHAVQTPRGTITISDQTTDGIFEYDTSGVFIRLFAPSTGVNTSILDNTRGHAYQSNGNLLGTVGTGPNINAIPQFDTGGAYLGTFITSGIASSWFIEYRTSDMLISVINTPTGVSKYDLNGTFQSTFASISSFPQQVHNMQNGNVAIANFSSGSQQGILIFPSAGGTFIKQLQGVTGNRGVWQLGNGNFLTTNGSGVHEVDSATGNLVRTIVPGVQSRLISFYDPDMLVGLENQNSSVPEKYSLQQNYPNPFNPSTTISFDIPLNGFVTLKVYDILGKEVKTLVNKSLTAGSYDFSFDASELNSGIYFYTLRTGDFAETKKMLLIK